MEAATLTLWHYAFSLAKLAGAGIAFILALALVYVVSLGVCAITGALLDWLRT